jgi:hypothetical protein
MLQFQVAPADLDLAGGAKRPVTALGVEEAGEHRRPVEAGYAEPVDRPLTADEGCRPAVGEQRIVRDRQVDHLALSPLSSMCTWLKVRRHAVTDW